MGVFGVLAGVNRNQNQVAAHMFVFMSVPSGAVISGGLAIFCLSIGLSFVHRVVVMTGVNVAIYTISYKVGAGRCDPRVDGEGLSFLMPCCLWVCCLRD